MIPQDDRGLLLGDGLFETILAEDGGLEFWDEHMARMARGCGVIGLAPPDAELARGAALSALEAAGLASACAVVRVTLTAGSGRGLERRPDDRPRLVVTASPYQRPSGPARLSTSDVRRNEGSPASRLKALSYLDNVLARREAVVRGADEALMLNTRGELACAAASNLFWIAGDQLFTPALECGVLDGIMRAQTMSAATELGAQARETRAGADVLKSAQAVFLTNSLMGVRAVCEIDGRPLGGHQLLDAIAGRRRRGAVGR
jgi:branched-chain amino acid aminotransferase/4-amino-4-deoxychorismate lyase